MNADIKQKICYVDANIFIYMFDESDIGKHTIANGLYIDLLVEGTGRISVQVISEWRNTVIKKFNPIIDTDTRRTFIQYLKA